MWKIAACAALAVAAVWALSLPGQQQARAVPETQFRRGVNILGYDPFWNDPNKARFKSKHFAEIRRAGFDFVRVNLFIFDHMDGQNQIDPDWLQRLDWVVANAKAAGLGVIIDEHDFGACKKDPVVCRVKLPAAWRQLAPRYRTEPPTVAFELLNEPHSFSADSWNAMIFELLTIVRATNPTRTVILGPRWYSSAELSNLRLAPNDRHIVVTFHYYDPHRFTHQGAPWSKLKDLSGVTWGTPADREIIRENFDVVAAWSGEHQRPILLGEFGAYDKVTPIDMRADYVGTVACQAERHGFGWAYWQFDSNFILWDMSHDTWVGPIKNALIGRGGQPNC
jgi:endoglucanase